VQRIFKYSDIQYTSLTLDKTLNSSIYRTLFYVNIYDSYKLLNTVRVFLAHPVYATYVFVASLTKMVHRYWFKFSHMPCDIFQCHTGSMWHWNRPISRESTMHHCKSHTLVGWGAAPRQRWAWLHTRDKTIMLWHNYHMAQSQ